MFRGLLCLRCPTILINLNLHISASIHIRAFPRCMEWTVMCEWWCFSHSFWCCRLPFRFGRWSCSWIVDLWAFLSVFSCWCFQRSWDVEALTQVAVQGSREDRFVREDNWALKAKEMYNKLSIIFLIHIIQGNYTCKVHVHVHVQDCVALPFRWTPSLE